MKKFLSKSLIFILLCAVVHFVVFTILILVYKAKIDSYAIRKDVKTVFIGDSHVQKAINDNLNCTFVNFGETSEATFYSYHKLKWLLSNNAQIEQVVLGFGYHNISDYYDDFISGRYSPAISSKYFFVLPGDEKLKLFFWNRGQLHVLFRMIKDNWLMLIKKGKISFLGKYKNTFMETAINEKSVKNRLQNQYYKKSQPRGLSEINITYLYKIVELCKRYKVHLHLLNTPVHPRYKESIPTSLLADYNRITADVNIPLLDFGDAYTGDSLFIPDGDHLSSDGAEQFTGLLSRELARGKAF